MTGATEFPRNIEVFGGPGADKFKRSRASKPKVKTGCLTCKIRRVKCDETKPSCIRCQKFGHQCDGYSKQRPAKTASSGNARPLVPRSPTLTESPTSPNTPGYQAAVHTVLQNEQDSNLFRRFCFQTSPQVSPFLSRDLWTRLMLQACETSPSARSAILSLGAFDHSAMPSPSGQVGTLRHQLAFQQYSQSVCLMRRDVAGGRHDLRTTLMSCLLFHCFDSYHDTNISGMQSNVKRIREWTLAYCRLERGIHASSRIGHGDFSLVEADVIRAFGNLEIQIMGYMDGRNALLHERYRYFGQSTIDEMPTGFYDLKEAKPSLEVVIKRSMHWLRSTMHLHVFSATPSPSTSPVLDKSETSAATDGLMSLFFDVDPSYEEQSMTLKEYERWDHAFQPMLVHARSRAAHQETFLQASMLRMHWLSGYLLIAGNNCHRNLVNGDRFRRELQELVDIASIFLSEGNRELALANVSDVQILLPLLGIGWLYRHKTLRRVAVELLMRSPNRRDQRAAVGGIQDEKPASWDGAVVGKIMAWLGSIEEQTASPRGYGCDQRSEEFVSEAAAVRNVKIDFDTDRSEARISCLYPPRPLLLGHGHGQGHGHGIELMLAETRIVQ